MTWYVARIEVRDNVLSVSFPDMPTIRVVADTVEKALESSAYLLKEELKSQVARGMKLGSPTRLLDLAPENEFVRYALIEIADANDEAHEAFDQGDDLPLDRLA
jgi:hypothetical protein